MISIIIPVYNGENYLRSCFNSVINQSYSDYEVIVINDGSTDSSLDIINEYVNKYSFKVFSQSNRGLAYSRNKGIELSNGQYLVFLDCDDEIESDYLLHLSSAINNDVDLGFSKLKRRYKGTFVLENNFNYISFIDSPKTNVFDKPELFVNIPNCAVAKIIRKDFIISNKVKFPEDRIYEDFAFTQKLLMNNPSVISIDDESYIYNIHSNSIMTSGSKKIYDIFPVFDEIINSAKQKNVFNRFFDEYEYLAIYHIAIGTTYRLFRWKPFKLFSHISICKKYLKQNGFSINNKYVKNCSWFVKLYLNLFFK